MVTVPEQMGFGGEQFMRLAQLRARLLCRISGCAVLSLTAFAGTGVNAGEWRVTPSLEISETYTDNVELSSIDRESDFITRISPGINVVGKSARLDVNVNYVANYLIFARSDEETDLRHNLNAGIVSELIEDWVYLDGRASINQQFIDRGGAISANEDNVTDNRQTVQSYSISPSIRRRLGSFADARLAYYFSYVKTGQPENPLVAPLDVLEDTKSHRVNLNLDSGSRFQRLRWGTSVDYRKENRASASSFEDMNYRFYGDYSVNRWLALVGSVGYEDIDDNTLSRDRGGFVWDAGVRLTPGPKSEVTIRGGRRYGDTNWSMHGVYRLSERSMFNIGYSEEITTSSRVLTDQLVFDRLNPAFDPGGFSLTDSAFMRKRWELGFSGSRKRNTFAFNTFHEKRYSDFVGTREKSYGIQGDFSRRLSRAATAFIGGTYRHSEFDSGREDDFYTGNVGLTYTFSQYLSGSATYFYTNRDSNEFLRDLKENAVRVTLRGTF